MDKKAFTLAELLITVAIIGILASIAIPTYTRYVQRGRMAQAYGDIQTIALANEKRFSLQGSYTNNFTVLRNTYGLSIPQTTRYYTLNISLPNANQFVIWAEPGTTRGTIPRRPCMQSDGLQGYAAANNPGFGDGTCAQADWEGR